MYTDKIAYSNSVDPKQTDHKGESVLSLHCLPFYHIFCETFVWKMKLKQKNSIELFEILRHLIKNILLEWQLLSLSTSLFEPRHSNYKMTSEASDDSEKPAHPHSLLRVFAVCLKTLWLLGYPQSALQTLIWVFTGCTCNPVGISMPWLIFLSLHHSILPYWEEW